MLAGIAKQLRHRARLGDFFDAWLSCDQRADSGAFAGDPFADRDSESALRSEGVCDRQFLVQPTPQQPLALPLANFKSIWKAERDGGDGWVEERGTPLNAVRHQTAIELDQQVVRQPVGAIDRLRHLQARAAGEPFGDLGCLDAIAPAARMVAQHAEPFELPAPPHRATAQPPRPDDAAIAAVAAEQLVSTLAAQYDLEAGLLCALRQHEGWYTRIVGRRIVHRRGDSRQQTPEIRGSHLDLIVLGAERLGYGASALAFIGHLRPGKPRGEGDYRTRVQSRHHRQYRRRIDPPGEEHAVWDVRSLMQHDAVLERRV